MPKRLGVAPLTKAEMAVPKSGIAWRGGWFCGVPTAWYGYFVAAISLSTMAG